MLIATLGAGCISASAILVTLANVGAITTTFFRCVLALPVLVPLAVLEQRRLGPRPLASRLYAMLAGIFLAIDLVLWNHAIADVGAGVATVLGNLQVLFVAVFAWLVLRERPDRRYLVMLPIVLIGIVLVSGMLGGHASGLHPVAGIGFGVATSAAYACFLLILRTTSGHAPHVAGQLADATAGATVGAIVLGLALGGLQLTIPWPSFGWLLTLALLSGTVGWLLITSSLPRLPAAMSSLLLLLQPAGALLLADVVLGERPTIVQVLGALLVCMGVLTVTRAAAARGGGPSGEAGRAGLRGDREQDIAITQAVTCDGAPTAGSPAVDNCPVRPRRDGAHRRQHVSRPVKRTVLQLVVVRVAADIRREPPVRKLGARRWPHGCCGRDSCCAAVGSSRRDGRSAAELLLLAVWLLLAESLSARRIIVSRRLPGDQPPGAVNAGRGLVAAGRELAAASPASSLLITTAASWTVWMP